MYLGSRKLNQTFKNLDHIVIDKINFNLIDAGCVDDEIWRKENMMAYCVAYVTQNVVFVAGKVFERCFDNLHNTFR